MGLMLKYKKYRDKYFDRTGKEFPHDQINEHSRWYKEEYDDNENIKYWENSAGLYAYYEYDNNKQLIRKTYDDNYWERWEYDSKGNVICWENSYGWWDKYKYDENEKLIQTISYGTDVGV